MQNGSNQICSQRRSLQDELELEAIDQLGALVAAASVRLEAALASGEQVELTDMKQLLNEVREQLDVQRLVVHSLKQEVTSFKTEFAQMICDVPHPGTLPPEVIATLTSVLPSEDEAAGQAKSQDRHTDRPSLIARLASLPKLTSRDLRPPKNRAPSLERKAKGPKSSVRLLPLTLRARTVTLTSDAAGAIQLTVLTPQPATVLVEVRVQLPGPPEAPGEMQQWKLSECDGKTYGNVTLQLFTNQPASLVLPGRARQVRASFRRVRGPLSILKIEPEPHDSPPAAMHAREERLRLRPDAHTLWHAQQMIHDGRSEEGLRHAIAYADDIERPAVNLLRATFSAMDAEWLWYVNRYMRMFDVTPLCLAPTNDSRFNRLAALGAEAPRSGPLVSVLMPAFNAERTLKTAASSILQQTWRSLELIIVDDASTDATWRIAQDIAAADSRVTVRRNTTSVGPYVCKNLMLNLVQGEYITCHDADDWAHPQRLEIQMDALVSSDSVACIGGMVRVTELGAFSFTKRGRNSHDGALRVAPVSCLLQTRFFREALGSWDSVRFGADGELLERLERIAEGKLLTLRRLLLFCLDSEANLTNHSMHGISRTTGLSPARRAYRDQWRQWHSTLDTTQGRMPFPPPEQRCFPAPPEAVVSETALRSALSGWSAREDRTRHDHEPPHSRPLAAGRPGMDTSFSRPI